VPWWLWALLAFFAADNLMSWLSSPLIFCPTTSYKTLTKYQRK
jgi:hypothetical protein